MNSDASGRNLEPRSEGAPNAVCFDAPPDSLGRLLDDMEGILCVISVETYKE